MLRAALAFGVGGVAFAGASLILAESLPVSEFAWIVLLLAFTDLSINLGPLGADVIINRIQRVPERRTWIRILATSALVGAALTIIASTYYEFPLDLSIVLLLIGAGCGTNRFASAVYQSEQKFKVALWISQGHSGILLMAAVFTYALQIKVAYPAFVMVAIGYVFVPALVWMKLSAGSIADVENGKPSIDWSEGYSIVARGLAAILLVQLERLSIPKLLGVEELGTFAVLAALAGSPFRVLQMSVQHTLLPRLRRAESPNALRHILIREALISSVLVFLSSVLIFVIVPPLVAWIFDGKYTLDAGLVLAALVAGTGKVLNAFSSVTVTSLGTKKELRQLNFLMWMSLSIAVCGAYVGSNWGLTGIIYGVALGWYLNFLAGAFMAAHHVRGENTAKP